METMNTIIKSTIRMASSSSLFAIVVVVVVITSSVVSGIGIINMAQAQEEEQTPSSALPSLPLPASPSATPSNTISPGQNPMCDPTDKIINTTESKVCGVPKTPMAPAGSTTTTTPTP
jgi:hypothetical protein